MTDDEMDFCEELHMGYGGLPLSAPSLLLPFNPVNEIDDVLYELSTREPDSLDWMALHSVARQARSQCQRIADGERLDLSGVKPTRAVLLTAPDSLWRPLLDELRICPDMPSMVPLISVIEIRARKDGLAAPGP